MLRGYSQATPSAVLTEESYFSFFYSTRQSQLITSSKYFCNLAFLILLGISISYFQIYLWIIMAPLFISNIVSLIAAVHETGLLWSVSETWFRLTRHISVIVDLLGSFIAKIIILFVLIEDYQEKHWTILLLPFWISVSLSSFLKCMHHPPRTMPPTMLTRHRVATIFTSIGYLMHRGLQPFLLCLRLDHFIQVRWSIIFAPAWFLVFFGMACAILLASFAPFVHQNTNSDLRSSSKALVYLLAFQLAAVSICNLTFLVLLSQKLDYMEYHEFGFNHSFFRILGPLIIMFVVLLILNPILGIYCTDYQVSTQMIAKY
jgi:hypothetical protein